MSLSRQEIETKLAELLPVLEEQNRALEMKLTAERKSAHDLVKIATQEKTKQLLIFIQTFFKKAESDLSGVRRKIRAAELELADINEDALTKELDDIDEKQVQQLKALAENILANPDYHKIAHYSLGFVHGGVRFFVPEMQRREWAKTLQNEAELLQRQVLSFIALDREFAKQYQAAVQVEEQVAELKTAWNRLSEEKTTCELLKKVEDRIQLTEIYNVTRTQQAHSVWQSFNSIPQEVKTIDELKIQSNTDKQQAQDYEFKPSQVEDRLKEVEQRSQDIVKRYSEHVLRMSPGSLIQGCSVLDKSTQDLRGEIKDYSKTIAEKRNGESGKGQKPTLRLPGDGLLSGASLIVVWIIIFGLGFLASPLTAIVVGAIFAPFLLGPAYLSIKKDIRQKRKNEKLRAHDKDEGLQYVLEKQDAISSYSRAQVAREDGIVVRSDIVVNDDKQTQVRYHNSGIHKEHAQLDVSRDKLPCQVRGVRIPGLDVSKAPLFLDKQRSVLFFQQANPNHPGEVKTEELKETYGERVEQYRKYGARC